MSKYRWVNNMMNIVQNKVSTPIDKLIFLFRSVNLTGEKVEVDAEARKALNFIETGASNRLLLFLFQLICSSF